MNSRDRFLLALKGEKVDYTPLAHISALTTIELQDITGCYMPEVHTNAEKLVKLCAANYEVLGFDAVCFIINYFNEPAALGCKMDWGNKSQLPMYLSHPWVEEKDAYVPHDLLTSEPISTYLKAIKIAKKEYKDKIAVLGKVMGPFSFVQVMHGVEKTMVDLIDEPEKIKYFLEIATDILIKCGNSQFDAGIDALAIGEGGAGGNLLSPDMHKKFLLDVHKRMIREIHCPAIMHICGDITPRLHLLAEIGLTCFNFDWQINPKTMKEFVKDRFKIMGNINTTDLLRGKPEDIENQVFENLESGTDIISPGCAISPECLNENLLAISKAIKKFKNYYVT